MEFKISTKILSKSLASVVGIAGRKAAMPILNNVLLSASETHISIKTSDLDVTMESTRTGDIKQAGAILVPAKAFANVIRVLDGDEVCIATQKNGRLEIKSDSAVMRLVGTNVEEFPSQPSLGDMTPVEVDSDILQQAIDKTVYASSTETSTRPNLCGVFMSKVNGETVCVGTDGHRIAIHKSKMDMPIPDGGIILPRSGLLEFSGVLSKSNPLITVEMNSRFARFSTPDCVLAMSTIEGTFPDYNQVLPTEVAASCSVSIDALVRLIKRVMVLSPDKFSFTRLDFSPDNIKMSCDNVAFGEAIDSVPTDGGHGSMALGCNPRLLLEALAKCSGEHVKILLQSPTTPIGIVDDLEYRTFIMPMRMT